MTEGPNQSHVRTDSLDISAGYEGQGALRVSTLIIIYTRKYVRLPGQRPLDSKTVDKSKSFTLKFQPADEIFRIAKWADFWLAYQPTCLLKGNKSV